MRRPIFTCPLPGSLIQALLKAGFKYLEDCFGDNNEILAECHSILKGHGFSWKDIEDLTSSPCKVNSVELFKKQNDVVSIPTFSEAVDNILDGGVMLGSTLQICGPPGSGKTQFLMQLCISVQLPKSMDGLGGEALFIDSETGFSKRRLTDMAVGAYNHCKRLAAMYDLKSDIKHLSADSLVRGVYYMHIDGGYINLLACVNLLRGFLSAHDKVKLVVLDSLVLPFLGMTNTLERTSLIAQLMNEFDFITCQFNVAVVFSNDLTTRIVKNEKILVPALGETLCHRSSAVLLLTKLGPINFSAALYKTSGLKQAIANFYVLKEGVRDAMA